MNYSYKYIQLKESEETVDLRYMDISYARAHGGVKEDNYRVADTGEIEAKDELSACEALYTIYNNDNRPDARKNRSMSMSDIIVLTEKQTREETYWYCDAIGFVSLRQDMM